ncbi:MAG: ATP-binding protein [Ktedonobacteraceae bacterium]
MESLNDIMMRSMQRRQEMQGQQSSQQGVPGEEQRPRQTLTRRPSSLPEQAARQGRQNSSAVPQQPRYSNNRQQRQQTNVPATNNGGEQNKKFPPRQPYDQVQHLRDIDRRSSVFYPRPQQPIQEPRHLASKQEYSQETGDYYDAYPAMPPADVQETWEDEAEDMRYGDWEDVGIGSERSYARRDPRAAFVTPHDAAWPPSRDMHLDNVQTARELTGIPLREAQGPSSIKRNPSEAQVRISPSHPLEGELPAPLVPTQEAQRYQRITQPLNPRAIAGVNPRLPQEHLRHAMTLKQAQQYLPAPTSAASLPKSACPKCKGAGYLRIDVPFGHPNFGKPVACECKEAERREKRRQELLELSDLSAFQQKSFKNFNSRFSGAHPSVQEAFQEAYRFAHDLEGWLVLVGPNGCGKTHLAAAIANQNLNNGSVVLFTVVPDLLAHLRSTFGPHATEAYDQRFAKMREAELLVLDDLGAHQSSPWASEKLFQILNYRYNSGFPTVITANQKGLASIDDRILSRLSDTGLVTAVVMNGALDYRRQNTRREPFR